MHMGFFAHVDVISGLKHPDVGQSPEPPTQNPDKPGDIDRFLLVRRATPTITQSDQKYTLVHSRLIPLRGFATFCRKIRRRRFDETNCRSSTSVVHSLRTLDIASSPLRKLESRVRGLRSTGRRVLKGVWPWRESRRDYGAECDRTPARYCAATKLSPGFK